jgi:MinD-like ATPase involved in chromosome partitioning or flagellar assembly
MVALWGPKGAPGRSSIAIELAYSFERSGKNTILIDADPYGGDLLQLLGVIDESPTIVWASRLAAKGELKETALARGLRRAGMEGPVLLPGLSRPELRRDVSDFGWQRALGILRGHFETTVVDVGFDLEEALEESPLNEGGRNRLTLSVLREADSVVAICRGDPVGIKQFIRAYDRLVSIVSAERVKLVVNRVAPGHEAEIGRLLKAGVGKKPVAYLPDRPDDLFQAALKGRSVAETKPRSSLLGEVDRLAAALGAPVKAQGVLLKLGGRS